MTAQTATLIAVGALLVFVLRQRMNRLVEAVTNRHQTEEEFWRSLLTGVNPGVPMYWMRRAFGLVGGQERCKVCSIPFNGLGSAPLRLVWSGQSNLTPHFCKKCEDFARRHIGGAEVCMTMFFVDVRGSTRLGESLPPAEFVELMNRFFKVAAQGVAESGGWIDKFVGDEVVGLYIPGFAGQDHAVKAVAAGRRILEATGHGTNDGAWVPVGVGLNTGTVFMGAMGDGRITDITAIGDEMNVAARMCSVADQGQMAFTEGTMAALGDQAETALRGMTVEPREVTVRGKVNPMKVYVCTVSRNDEA